MLVTQESLFHRLPAGRTLAQLDRADLHEALWQAGLEQDSLRHAALHRISVGYPVG